MLEALPWHKVHLFLQVQCSARGTPVVFGVSTAREAGGTGSREEVLPVRGLGWGSMIHGSIPGAFQQVLNIPKGQEQQPAENTPGEHPGRAAAPPSSGPV